MSAALRVLYVSPWAALAGAERVMLDLLTLHDRSVVEPSVCFLHEGPLVETCRALGVPTFVVAAPRLRRYFAARRAVQALADIVRAHGIQLVHSTMAWGHCFGGRAARRARCAAVWSQHDIPVPWRGLDTWAAAIPARSTIANSAFTASHQARVHPRRSPVRTIHPGTRMPVEPREVRRARGRRALGIAENEFAVGIVGRLHPGKGQHVAIPAAASLLHARPASRMLVLGSEMFGLEEGYLPRLQQLARDLAVADRVTFTGYRDDVGDCLAALDIAIQASTVPESFGLALVEAMAAGTALVAARGGATAEIVTDGMDGLLVPPADHEALALALLALHDDPPRRAALAEAGLTTVQDRFDVNDMVLQVEHLYGELTAR